jgi:septum site-determining protein MinC
VRTLDVHQLANEMRERVQRAPNLFGRAAVVLDFGGLSNTPSLDEARALVDGLREVGVFPVALAYGTKDVDAMSQALGLPLLAKFRAQYEHGEGEPEPTTTSKASKASKANESSPAPASAKPAPAKSAPGLVHASPVRSGQQVYADNRDLSVVSTVGAGAEVIADGSIHIYGPLRGRALAGAQGDESARIFCREFHAELVAIAGHYKVLEDIPAELHGKAVQVWLEQGQLKLAALD